MSIAKCLIAVTVDVVLLSSNLGLMGSSIYSTIVANGALFNLKGE